MSGIAGLVSASMANVYRERAFQDALAGRRNRVDEVRRAHGAEAATAYATGYRRGLEQRKRVMA